MIPFSHQKIASDIAESWRSGTNNYVLVAPPLTEPELVFQLLRDEAFLRHSQVSMNEVAVAWVSPAMYRSSEEFVQRVCDSWGVKVSKDDCYDHLDVLGNATRSIHESGKRPIILLPKFHKTIDKLSWSLGAHLREFEFQYGLSTVVESPVPLSSLRERWEIDPAKEEFICSDFGQGHLVYVLGRMDEKEIAKSLERRGVSKDIFRDEVQTLSGGLPGLVKWLSDEARSVASVQQLRANACHGGTEQCKRFIDWLDAPGGRYFLEAVAKIHLGVASEDEFALLKAHDWGELLINRNNKLLVWLVGNSCVELGELGKISILRNSLTELVSSKVYQTASAVLESLPYSLKSDKNFVFYGSLVAVLEGLRGISPDWKKLNKLVSKSLTQGSKLGIDQANKNLHLTLQELRRFTETMCEWNLRMVQKEKEGWQLGDILCGRDESSLENCNLPALQLVAFRLKEARDLAEQDHGAAMKSILELPEQILQIYCSRVLGIEVWSSPSFPAETINGVEEIWKAGAYRKPATGSRLGFVHLLYIGWITMQNLPTEKRIFESESDLEYWGTIYSDLRSPSSHSITNIKPSQWEKYSTKCEQLLSRLSEILIQKDLNDVLPPIHESVLSIIRCTP